MSTTLKYATAVFALTICTAMAAQAQAKQQEWPLVFTSNVGQVQVFKPQPESFDGTSFTARAAVALQREKDASPVFGAIWGNGVLAVDREDRLGKVTSFKVTDARFPGITKAEELARIKEALSEGIPENAAPIPIDWLVAALDEEKQNTASYDNAPPQIIYRDKPSILLFIDGEPIYGKVEPAEPTGDPVYSTSAPALERVANTPYLVVRPKGGNNWLYGSGLWYESTNILGPWEYRKKAPSYLEDLAAKVDTSGNAQRADGIIPEVVVSTKPAVLLDINGSPKMEPFPNSSLMYVTNTDKDLFLDIPTQEYYLLASGRWYATKDLRNGPWRFVPSDALPADFAQVPEGSPKDGILAHVSGTDAAREAVRDASIPQTAQVERNKASVTVRYDGDPQFRKIAGTDIYSAENASTTVLRIDGTYHVCDNAVWYEGNSPDGPWAVSTSVPAEVNNIPPTDPDYRVRYVYIYDYTPEVVFTGYTPGYLGSYVQYGTVIYGTGYYYNPWRSSYWYPRPYTWGFNMNYNPWYGWGFGASWGYNWFYPSWNYYGYYRPYSWGWWGPYAYCPPVAGWHHHGYYGHRGSVASSSNRSGRYATGQQGMRSTGVYSNHRVEGVRPSEINRETLAPSGRTATGGVAGNTREMQPIKGDHFTDRAGNVYRNTGGQTEELRNGRWSKVEEPAGTTPSVTDSRSKQHSVQDSNRQPNTLQKQPSATERPVSTQPGRGSEPYQGRSPVMDRGSEPQRIERDRMRGEQRVNDFRNFQQERATSPSRSTPAPGRAPSPPQRTAPPPARHSMPSAPRQSAPPMRSAPSAPSHGAPAGGGNGGGRRPR